MTWMLTATGAQLDLRFLRDDAISLLDIAHHLSQINRFTGACSRPMSVAEHSLLVLAIVEDVLPAADAAVLMAALMHDAHEAYTADLSSPMKQVIGEAWRCEEDRIQRAVLARFGLLEASTNASKLIHWADMTALVTERKHLMPHTGPAWEAERLHEPFEHWHFANLARFTWEDWRDLFVEKFGELQYARSQALALVTSAGTSEGSVAP